MAKLPGISVNETQHTVTCDQRLNLCHATKLPVTGHTLKGKLALEHAMSVDDDDACSVEVEDTCSAAA